MAVAPSGPGDPSGGVARSLHRNGVSVAEPQKERTLIRRVFLKTASVATVALGISGWSMSLAGSDSSADIVDTAVAGGTFQTLVAAVQAADLVDTLKSDGPFTVFAPTDDAFAKLPEGTVETLLRPENKDQLVAVLTYHVVPGKVMSGDIAGMRVAPETVQGRPLAINAQDGVMVNDARVVSTDIVASNGVVHVIDTVLIP